MNIRDNMFTSSVVAFFVILCLAGCQGHGGNVGQLQSYSVPSIEEAWIRNGEPIKFANEKWYPCDDVENLLDSEVYILGEYRGIQFFVEKTDVRPYNRLDTKFSRNRFRFFEKRAKPGEDSNAE